MDDLQEQQTMIRKLLFQIDAMQKWSGYDQVRFEHQIEMGLEA
jgi:hypothetical protein